MNEALCSAPSCFVFLGAGTKGAILGQGLIFESCRMKIVGLESVILVTFLFVSSSCLSSLHCHSHPGPRALQCPCLWLALLPQLGVSHRSVREPNTCSYKSRMNGHRKPRAAGQLLSPPEPGRFSIRLNTESFLIRVNFLRAV